MTFFSLWCYNENRKRERDREREGGRERKEGREGGRGNCLSESVLRLIETEVALMRKDIYFITQ